ncbi:MAG: hypothetical protein V7L23_05230 [Nostoc sp.]|uniref:hypothetical protein n=1 Tax=Nostoc sp. TaxID=1180 RepID=UPI002FF33CBF
MTLVCGGGQCQCSREFHDSVGELIGGLTPDFSPHLSKPVLVQGSRGAGEQGSRGAGEQRSRGAEEQGRVQCALFFPLCPSAPLPLCPSAPLPLCISNL